MRQTHTIFHTVQNVSFVSIFIVKLPGSAWGSGVRVDVSSRAIVGVESTHTNDPVGGDISPDGTEILVKVRIWSLFPIQ